MHRASVRSGSRRSRRMLALLLAVTTMSATVACGGDDDGADTVPATESDVAPDSDGDTTGDAAPQPEDDSAAAGGDDAGSAAGPDPALLPTDPWDPSTIDTVAFTPPIECPLLSYDEANEARGSNLQPLEVTDSSCMFDNGNIIDGELFVAIGSPGTFDPADPSFVSELDPIITVEDAAGPGTGARLMSLDIGGELLHYGLVFDVDGTEVLVTADRMRFDVHQLTTLADHVAARVPGATFSPATAAPEATGAGWCSLYDAAAIEAGLGVRPLSASWQRGDIGGCAWRSDFEAIIEVSEPIGGSVDPNSDDPELVIDGLGAPAARDTFADWIVNVEIDGVHVVVSSRSFDDSVVIARNLVERAAS